MVPLCKRCHATSQNTPSDGSWLKSHVQPILVACQTTSVFCLGPLCASQSAHASQPTYACQPVSTCQHISDASVCLIPQCDAHDHAMSLCLEFLFMSRSQWNNPIRLSHTLHVIRVHMSCTTHSCHMLASATMFESTHLGATPSHGNAPMASHLIAQGITPLCQAISCVS